MISLVLEVPMAVRKRTQPRPNTSIYTPPSLWERFKAAAYDRDTRLTEAHKEALEMWLKAGRQEST
jgi:hypothetical protein